MKYIVHTVICNLPLLSKLPLHHYHQEVSEMLGEYILLRIQSNCTISYPLFLITAQHVSRLLQLLHWLHICMCMYSDLKLSLLPFPLPNSCSTESKCIASCEHMWSSNPKLTFLFRFIIVDHQKVSWRLASSVCTQWLDVIESFFTSHLSAQHQLVSRSVWTV